MAFWEEPYWLRIGAHVSFLGQMKSSSKVFDREIIRRVVDIMGKHGIEDDICGGTAVKQENV